MTEARGVVNFSFFLSLGAIEESFNDWASAPKQLGVSGALGALDALLETRRDWATAPLSGGVKDMKKSLIAETAHKLAEHKMTGWGGRG